VLAGGLVAGVQMAVSMSNTGGAWDNAKKYIEVGVTRVLAGAFSAALRCGPGRAAGLAAGSPLCGGTPAGDCGAEES
jgi:hypothetical protein